VLELICIVISFFDFRRICPCSNYLLRQLPLTAPARGTVNALTLAAGNTSTRLLQRRAVSIGRPLRDNLLPLLEATMRMTFTLCLLVLAGTAAIADCSTALPGLPGENVQSGFYPLKVGNKWHYRASMQGNSGSITMHLANLEKVGGVDLFRLDMIADGQVLSTEHVAADKGGVFRHRCNDQDFEKPICILKSPFKQGEKWQQTLEVEDEVLTISGKAGAEEEVQVPAGKFKAIPVRLEVENVDGTVIINTNWYAANVGIVRQIIELPNGQMTLELERYELVR
jgi:hypothetical protein